MEWKRRAAEAEERAAAADAAAEAADDRAATAEAAVATAEREARGLEALCLDLRDQVQPAAKSVRAEVPHQSELAWARMLITVLCCPVGAECNLSL